MGIFSLVPIRESEVLSMTLKYSKTLALAAAAAITVMSVPALHAADPVVPVTTTAVITTGSITVVQEVINDNDGTKMATDFTMSVSHWGAAVAGSPFVSVSGAGKTFVLEAGSYVVSQQIYEGYTGSWSGVGVTNGFIDLQPGQAITITRTLNDDGTAPSTSVVTEDPATADPVTENGGLLPNTATPWFNLLVLGSLITAAGALGVRKSVNLHKV